MKHDQLHGLNCIKWTWINLDSFKAKEENILAARKIFFLPKIAAP